MGSLRLNIDARGLTSDFQVKKVQAQNKGTNLIRDVLNVLGDYSQTNAPYFSGELRDGIQIMASLMNGELTSTAPHSIFVIMGTKPHPIDPIPPNQFLWWPGAWHPVRHVDHPGTAPNDFLQESIESSESNIDDLCNEFGDWVVE